VSETTPFAVDHIGVITDDLSAVRRLAAQLGLECRGPEPAPEVDAEVLWLTLGTVRLEVLCPAHPNSRVARALETSGRGIHHVALTVTDLEASLAGLRQAGATLADTTPRDGLHGARIAFLDAAAAGGLRVELVQPPAGS
jgi:methylmalonyl-CoA/ethylmalonyl-CoA epimerase